MNKIDRRFFIKGAVSAVAVGMSNNTILPMVERVSGGQVLFEKGMQLPLFLKPTNDVINKCVEKVLIPNAIKVVGRGSVVEILLSGPWNYGRNYGIAWYTNNIIMTKQPERVSSPKVLLDSRRIFCGRIVV